MSLVRGTTRRVIVVNSPDTELFEQAIFIVRADAASEGGVTAQRLVDEACSVANSCVRPRMPRRRSTAPRFWSGMGAGFIGLIWLLTTFI